MKKDFLKFMVHLQHGCTHCRVLMISGTRWVCNLCANFQLCQKCYEAEQMCDDIERHPINLEDKHTLYPVEIVDVPDSTTDKDNILENEDYFLAFQTTCNICSVDITSGQGWHCETCLDYDVCNSCFQKNEGNDHLHKLVDHPSVADLISKMKCRSPHCLYPGCRKVKDRFRHAIQCRTRAAGGCDLCKKVWYFLQLHARACKESECFVPRCRDLKEHLRRLEVGTVDLDEQL